MKALMDDHGAITALVRAIVDGLDEAPTRGMAETTAELAELFARHAEREELGLFRQLSLAGEATDVLDRLVEEHRQMCSGLSDPGLGERPEHLRALVGDLLHHAAVEETDLFPFALQVLPGPSWAAMGQSSTGHNPRRDEDGPGTPPVT